MALQSRQKPPLSQFAGDRNDAEFANRLHGCLWDEKCDERSLVKLESGRLDV